MEAFGYIAMHLINFKQCDAVVTETLLEDPCLYLSATMDYTCQSLDTQLTIIAGEPQWTLIGPGR